jgi:hypothetical protein
MIHRHTIITLADTQRLGLIKGDYKMNLEVINSQEVLGKDFKIYGDYDNPLFLAKDVLTGLSIVIHTN